MAITSKSGPGDFQNASKSTPGGLSGHQLKIWSWRHPKCFKMNPLRPKWPSPPNLPLETSKMLQIHPWRPKWPSAPNLALETSKMLQNRGLGQHYRFRAKNVYLPSLQTIRKPNHYRIAAQNVNLPSLQTIRKAKLSKKSRPALRTSLWLSKHSRPTLRTSLQLSKNSRPTLRTSVYLPKKSRPTLRTSL